MCIRILRGLICFEKRAASKPVWPFLVQKRICLTFSGVKNMVLSRHEEMDEGHTKSADIRHCYRRS